ncbi:PREDICTED: probable receptor-like protein kinase At5g24010 [Ipomoea nil]|uniref:probable receptor-like protein kinase At5g24010 n=1 Tax=Ipomoea nil TaxID=35883 RepID=UPI000901465A|nr:PREDICTED: probable receptor-like protein kinase At5g24010 [Ipomoea nil]
MESFHFLSLFPLLPFLSIFFSFPLHSHADYVLPDHYFINCGSDSNVQEQQRTFSGDDHFTGGTSVVEDPNLLYKTARIFNRKSGYELKTEQDGPYTVRLHFYPFSSSPNLSDARFNVTALGDSLLSNFGVSNSSSNLPVIKEFLVSVKTGWKLMIEFIPSPESSFAFVNAIEAFPAPDTSIPPEAPAVDNKMNKNTLSSNVLHVIYRINVGGPLITSINDTWWRNWEPDDHYLLSSGSERIQNTGRPNYQYGGATQFDAPDFVYTTARKLNLNDNPHTKPSNITWRFSVNNNTSHFLRLHFSDIVAGRNETQFNVSVYDEFLLMVSPYDIVHDLNTPFYLDYVVNSDASGFMKVSVSPLLGTSNYSFLNGLEIMQISKDEVKVPDGSGHKGKSMVIVIGSVVGGLAFIFLCGVAVWFYLKSKKIKEKPVETSEFPFDQIFGASTQSRSTEKSVISLSPDMNLGLKVALAEILSATKNFDPKRMIGEGGFGKVYKGTMRNGVKVAVKRSEPGHGQGLLEFQTEIMILSKIRHRHLVSLIGYCVERYEMILVYEFMEKGTLRDHIYNLDEQSAERSYTSRSELSWVQRLEACIGSAKGLHYLHSGLDMPIIHRDIKSTNILLDEQYVAKVADFGLSRSGPLDQSHVSTVVKGSFGYLDPEYYRCMQLTQKSDVYSFGVVLLEVLCARPAINNLLPREQVNLADWGMSWQKKGELAKIIDPFLVDKINPSSLRKFGETTEKCLQENGVDRPSMADVLWDLEYALRLQQSGMPLNPREDSMTDVSLQLPPPIVRRLPSNIMPVSQEEDYDSQTLSAGLEASAVFSQLNIEDAR